ncbi:MAG: hypothetical protein J5I53_03165 [Bradyrhizobiaceae bacterium]|nr:hypothetical protein [Bradyrhizobiaceae bacterium]
MATPLQERSYELLLRASTIEVDCGEDDRLVIAANELFANVVELSVALEDATTAPDRASFRTKLHQVNGLVKRVKLWLRLLDDLGRIEPESASPLYDTAEEVHRLVIMALRTSQETSHAAVFSPKAVL